MQLTIFWISRHFPMRRKLKNRSHTAHLFTSCSESTLQSLQFAGIKANYRYNGHFFHRIFDFRCKCASLGNFSEDLNGKLWLLVSFYDHFVQNQKFYFRLCTFCACGRNKKFYLLLGFSACGKSVKLKINLVWPNTEIHKLVEKVILVKLISPSRTWVRFLS